jgi:hypothetical protein
LLIYFDSQSIFGLPTFVRLTPLLQDMSRTLSEDGRDG